MNFRLKSIEEAGLAHLQQGDDVSKPSCAMH